MMASKRWQHSAVEKKKILNAFFFCDCQNNSTTFFSSTTNRITKQSEWPWRHCTEESTIKKEEEFCSSSSRFYCQFADQSNLYSVQIDPNKPLSISENEMEQFISILIMTGVYSFTEQRFFWMNPTRVESLSLWEQYTGCHKSFTTFLFCMYLCSEAWQNVDLFSKDAPSNSLQSFICLNLEY
jgi:hypothetical protein